MDFKDQVAIVTGGTRGIGKGIAESFLKAGARVIVTYSGNEEAANKMREENLEMADRLDIKKFDVSNADEVKSFYSYVEVSYPSVQILINNAGIRKDKMALMMSDDEWSRVIDINLTGTFNMTKGALALFKKERYGRIVNISSVGGVIGLAGQANYAATKAAVVAMSKSISKEMGKRGVTINNVLPGFIETDILDGIPEKLMAQYKEQVPLKRFGTVAEVAAAVLFLASKEASYINGASLEVSGGL